MKRKEKANIAKLKDEQSRQKTGYCLRTAYENN